MHARRVVALTGLAVVIGMAAAPARGAEAAGQIESVTLYRGEALITRLVPVEGPEGALELVVPGLPEHVVPDSLYASSDAAAEIRAVRLRARAVGEEPREEVKKLDQSLEKLRDETAAIQAALQVIGQRTRYLDRLEAFVVPSAQLELSKGVLNAETLKSLTNFVFDQRQTMATDQLKHQTRLRDLSQQIALAERKRQELSSGYSKTVREAVVFLQKKQAARTEIRLHYLVTRASWTPFYNIRAKGDRSVVEVNYNATVSQMSGEDWTNVRLVLSTASPRLRAQGPDLAPFTVSLAASHPPQQDGQQRAAGRYHVEDHYAQVQQNLQKAGAVLQRARGWERTTSHNWEINKWANECQNLELQVGTTDLAAISAGQRKMAEGFAVSYVLPGQVSLASRTDQQLIQIAALSVKGRFYYVAVPVLTNYVYEHAEITNTSPVALLAGDSSVFLDGRFVGHGELQEVAPGQEFTVGFGADSQLKAGRELLEKTERFQGGNKEMTFKYRLSLENYKDQEVKVRLLDRIPKANREADIRVTLGAMKEKLSTDEIYLRDERPKGLLRWDIAVPARSSGAKTLGLEYAYSVEFDRKLTVLSPRQLEEQLKEEFDKLQEKRYKK